MANVFKFLIKIFSIFAGCSGTVNAKKRHPFPSLVPTKRLVVILVAVDSRNPNQSYYQVTVALHARFLSTLIRQKPSLSRASIWVLAYIVRNSLFARFFLARFCFVCVEFRPMEKQKILRPWCLDAAGLLQLLQKQLLFSSLVMSHFDFAQF